MIERIQRRKISKAIETIRKHLPKHYNIPDVRVYMTAEGMLRSLAKECGMTLKSVVEHYEGYSSTYAPEDGYIANNPYLKGVYKSGKHKKGAYDFIALACEPIKINVENTMEFSYNQYLYSLLHEIGHLYHKSHNKPTTERLADEFALRWMKKITNS